MSRSFAQPADLRCARCGRSFSAEVWLLVDAEERPDLAAEVAAATIHSVRCPHCGHAQPLDAPLLFHDGRVATLIFAPAAASTPEQDQAAARQLGQHLLASIPPAARRPYLAAAQLVASQDELRRILREPPAESDALSAALPPLMAAASPAEVAAAAAQHPVLTTDAARAQLRDYVEQLRATGHPETAAALEQRLAALGASSAPAAPATGPLVEALLAAASPEERQAVLSGAGALPPELPAVLAALAEQAQRQQLDAVARDLLVIRAEVLDRLGRPTPRPPSG